MATNGEQCFGQEALKWEQCPGIELEGSRKRIMGRLCCDVCFRSAALEDPLTGLPNRQSLSTAFEEFKDNEQLFGALSIDLTNFKHANDTFGHSKGDELLVHTAKFFQEGIREGDDFFVSRHGGDEFAILLRLTGREDKQLSPEERLQAAGERLIDRYSSSETIAQYNADSAVPSDKRLSMRYGSAVWQEGMQLDELIAQADAKGPRVK